MYSLGVACVRKKGGGLHAPVRQALPQEKKRWKKLGIKAKAKTKEKRKEESRIFPVS